MGQVAKKALAVLLLFNNVIAPTVAAKRETAEKPAPKANVAIFYFFY